LVNDLVITIYNTLLDIYPLDATLFLNVIHSQEYIFKKQIQLDLVRGFQIVFPITYLCISKKLILYFLNIVLFNVDYIWSDKFFPN
jgi:hypothetical protein